MHTNIIPFPANRPATPDRAIAAKTDNIVSLARWRERARLRRTSGGVFFTTDVLCANGAAA